jgi:hypothetical protein
MNPHRLRGDQPECTSREAPGDRRPLPFLLGVLDADKNGELSAEEIHPHRPPPNFGNGAAPRPRGPSPPAEGE